MDLWIEQLLHINEKSRPGIPLVAQRGYVMHWTGDPGATDEREVEYFDKRAERYAGAHIFVDNDSARLDIPLNEVGYHANEHPCRIPKLKATCPQYKSGDANLTTIGLELCVEKDGTIHPDTISRAVLIVAELCRRFNLDPINDGYRHFDITGKNCPAPWVENPQLFVDFKNRVKEELQPKPAAKAAESKPVPIGKITILKKINLWQRNDIGTLKFVRILNPGEQYRVYGYDELHGGQYNVGAGNWVTNMDGYLKYDSI